MQFEQMTIAALAAYLDQNEQLGAVEEEMLLADRRRGVHLLLERYKKRKASLQKEHVRLQKMLSEESYFWKKGYEFVAGVDEAGRGPLAGPVAAAAVILQPGVLIIGLNDSKKLSAGQRDELFVQIKKSALGTGVGIATREEIDRMNIHAASMLAMNRALEQLTHLPEMVLVDGFPIRGCRIKQKAIKGGDALSLSIAAASVLAKVTRDRIMIDMHQQYPHYGFNQNKGYGTYEHYRALSIYGLCPEHRRSFNTANHC